RSTLGLSVTSTEKSNASARPPLARTCSASAFPSFGRRDVTATAAPSRTSAAIVARPMPPVAPTTNAVWPVRSSLSLAGAGTSGRAVGGRGRPLGGRGGLGPGGLTGHPPAGEPELLAAREAVGPEDEHEQHRQRYQNVGRAGRNLHVDAHDAGAGFEPAEDLGEERDQHAARDGAPEAVSPADDQHRDGQERQGEVERRRTERDEEGVHRACGPDEERA